MRGEAERIIETVRQSVQPDGGDIEAIDAHETAGVAFELHDTCVSRSPRSRTTSQAVESSAASPKSVRG